MVGKNSRRRKANHKLFDRTRISPDGQQMGAVMSALAEAGLKVSGRRDRRCSTCAFRSGSVPNGCIQTMSDAAKCLAESHLFNCHYNTADPCQGFHAASIAYPAEMRKPVEWEFSPDE